MNPSLCPTIAVLLSTYNGEKYLRAQLDSLLAQTYKNWVLVWRDDESADGTVLIMETFSVEAGEDRCITIQDTPRRLGAARSFLHLLAGAQTYPLLAFMDQDDIWLPNKLARAVEWMRDYPIEVPALYCGRQILVDAGLKPLRLSSPLRRSPGFPSALIQNVATGCTMVLNEVAAQNIARIKAPDCTLHDWWAYIVVSALDGVVLFDDEPMILYRQHATSTIGAPTVFRRAVRAIRRGAGPFYSVLNAHIKSLQGSPCALNSRSTAVLQEIEDALRGGPFARLSLLTSGTLERQTVLEDLLMMYWLLKGPRTVSTS